MKSLLPVLLLLASAAAPGATAAPDPSLLVHLDFEDRSARPVDAAGAKATLHGRAGYGRGPEGASAITLVDGAFLQIARPRAFVQDTQAITVAFWVRAAEWPARRRIVQKGPQDEEWRIILNEKGELVWHVHGKTAGAVYVRPPAPGVWTHLAAVYGEGRLRLFLDGRQVAERTTGPERMSFGRSPIVIGAGWDREGNAVEPFAASFDDFRCYNRALTAEEVAALAAR